MVCMLLCCRPDIIVLQTFLLDYIYLATVVVYVNFHLKYYKTIPCFSSSLFLLKISNFTDDYHVVCMSTFWGTEV